MNSPHQVEVAAEAFHRASERRETLRKQARQYRKVINYSERKRIFDEEIARLEEVKHDAKVNRDLMQAHADRLFRKGKVEKAKKKVARRNEYHRAWQDAYRQIGILRHECSSLVRLLREREQELNLNASEREYHEARHVYMVAIRDSELGDEQARRRVESYLACIDDTIDASDVLYYRIGDKIHLFYGGGRPPGGGDPLPDGPEHGHAVLAVTYDGSRARQYYRYPATQ